MLTTVLVVFGFTALVFMWYHRIRRHDRKLWKPWAVTADIFMIFGCIFQFLMKLNQGNLGEAKVDLLFAFGLVTSAWMEFKR